MCSCDLCGLSVNWFVYVVAVICGCDFFIFVGVCSCRWTWCWRYTYSQPQNLIPPFHQCMLEIGIGVKVRGWAKVGHNSGEA